MSPRVVAPARRDRLSAPPRPTLVGLPRINPLHAVNGTGAHRIGPIHQRPQNVTEVLCRELGAAHPDGALRQIRTMKRVLRTHYVAQKRLERYGVDSSMNAASKIESLRSQLDAVQSAREARARANVETLDAALDVLQQARSRLRDLARTPEATQDSNPGTNPDAKDRHAQSGDGSTPDGGTTSDYAAPPGSEHPETSRETGDASPDLATLEAFDTVVSELDELRLELWVEAGEPDPEENEATSGINRLLDRLQNELESVSAENEKLRAECRRLRRSQSSMAAELKRRIQRIRSRRSASS